MWWCFTDRQKSVRNDAHAKRSSPSHRSCSFRKVNEAHQIVQQYEEPTAAWIHAVLHKIEGDQANSRYWYRRAGKMEHFDDEPKGELGEIKSQVAGRE